MVGGGLEGGAGWLAGARLFELSLREELFERRELSALLRRRERCGVWQRSCDARCTHACTDHTSLTISDPGVSADDSRADLITLPHVEMQC